MQTGTRTQAAEGLASGKLPGTTDRQSLSIGEFLQLGMFRLAYLTRVKGHDGQVDLVIHGADGMAVAVVDTAEMAADLGEQLGLSLVSVH